MTINAIIKKAFTRLQKENKLLTPFNYAEVFCKEAKAAGIVIDDCNEVQKYTKTLNANYQNELKQYHLTSSQELIRYLISKLNRLNPGNCITLLESTNLLLKRVLDVMEVLHNKDASKLARQTKKFLGGHKVSIEQLDTFRQLWVNFLTTYDDTFLQKLKLLGEIQTADLKTTIENLDISKRSSLSIDFETISSLIISSLKPSIASSVNEKMLHISNILKNNPEMVTSKSVQDEIKQAIGLRISLDKSNLKNMLESLDNLLDKLSMQLLLIIEKSDRSSLDIKAIKIELENYKSYKNIDFKTAHKKLYSIAVALEDSSSALCNNANVQHDRVQELSKRVEMLEHELQIAKEVAQEDFLTKLYNKRALDKFLNIKESEYDRYGRDYSVVMFDIDHFKRVNDTFGHEAGDVILSSFAKILKDASRSVDVIGRFGGEEFMAILSQTDLSNAILFAQKVLLHVKKAKFIYKGQRIDLTVSAGAAQRSKLSSSQETVNSSDEQLYAAKHNGRDRVEPTF